MLECEGYKMFHGAATINPNNIHRPELKPFEVTGTWLYKPEYECWYVNGHSYPAEIVSDFHIDQQPTVDWWVSVKEHLPEYYKPILFTPPGYTAFGYYASSNNHFAEITTDGIFYHDDVTHWQPLPTPPEAAQWHTST